jgi:3-deoxy-D-arabino-heptulosonate 7-phosphate (DAHP) synthase
MIKRGDRVKLTARAAAAFNNKHKFVWTDPRGVVERITANKATAIVLRDGRKSQDNLPIRSIELEQAELVVSAVTVEP